LSAQENQGEQGGGTHVPSDGHDAHWFDLLGQFFHMPALKEAHIECEPPVRNFRGVQGDVR
jgi:hypothetical protein